MNQMFKFQTFTLSFHFLFIMPRCNPTTLFQFVTKPSSCRLKFGSNVSTLAQSLPRDDLGHLSLCHCTHCNKNEQSRYMRKQGRKQPCANLEQDQAREAGIVYKEIKYDESCLVLLKVCSWLFPSFFHVPTMQIHHKLYSTILYPSYLRNHKIYINKDETAQSTSINIF